MKKFLSLGIIVSMVMLCFCSCAMTIVPTEVSHTDCEGVFITIDSIDDGGDKPILNVTWHNTTEDTVVFGKAYTIEYLDGEQWKNIQIKDFAVIEIACILEPGDTVRQSYSTAYFNMLRSGTYRIKTEFYLQGDEPKSGITWAEFEQVKQGE